VLLHVSLLVSSCRPKSRALDAADFASVVRAPAAC
jgi:hypothetical protein